MPSVRPVNEAVKDWHLRDWMRHRGKIQADIVRDLGWERGRASKIYNGKQPYQRSDVVQLSAWLGIEPFELLMAPHEALNYRNLRAVAHQIVAEGPATPFDHEDSSGASTSGLVRTGT